MALFPQQQNPMAQSKPVMPMTPHMPMQHFADGGMPMSMQDPWFEKREAGQAMQGYHPGGLYNTAGGGRTDNIANMVPAGAYVMPADVVSGLGEGNTHAGAAIMDKMFHTNPYGIEGSKMTHGIGMPARNTKLAKGGEAKNHKGTHVPIVTAGGEYLIRPEDIIAKFGDLKRGHAILDDFVVHVRKKTVKEMSKLPGPKR
jgi:hypothetical protein